MKYFPPLALAVLLTACATTPEDKQAARVHQLEKEARENFIAMKAQEHPGRPVVLHDEAATPAPKISPFFGTRPPAATPAPFPKPRAKATMAAAPTPPPKPLAVAKMTAPPKPAPKATPIPLTRRAPVAQPAPKPKPAPKAAPKPKAPKNNGDTIYFWQVNAPSHPNSTRYQRAEAIYARKLAKRPEDLTPEERVWAHEHY